MTFARGEIIDRYALLERVGQGGQGEVWRAADRVDGSPVALKLLRESSDERANERARREARALARIQHPSLLRCLALFEDPARHLIGLALEWVDGSDLERARGLLDRRQRRAAITHLIVVLAHLHQLGVVHRDIKLSNVLLAERFFAAPDDPNTLKLADLGIASAIGNPAQLTTAGVQVGTLPYLAPEILDPRRWELRDASPSQDVFAFGVAAWRLLFDHHPTGLPEGSSLREYAETYADFADTEGAWLADAPDQDPSIAVIKRCLALDPRSRWADAQIARDALAAQLTP